MFLTNWNGKASAVEVDMTRIREPALDKKTIVVRYRAKHVTWRLLSLVRLL